MRIQAAERLVGAAATNGMTGALIGIAAEKGYFREEGLDVQIYEYATGSLGSRAMSDGEADIAYGRGFLRI